MKRKSQGGPPPILIRDGRPERGHKYRFSKTDCVDLTEHELIALSAQYNRFPRDGRDMQGFAQSIIDAYTITTVVLQVRNRLPGLPMNLVLPKDWETLSFDPDISVFQFQPAGVTSLAPLFDDCAVRAYWMFSFLPAPFDKEDTQVVNRDFCGDLLIEPENHGGVFLFVDTDDCGVVATLPSDRDCTDHFLSKLIELGLAQREMT